MRSAFRRPARRAAWNIDHALGFTVHRGDGGWRHPLGYRVLENGETVFQLCPTPQSGSYLEELLQPGTHF